MTLEQAWDNFKLKARQVAIDDVEREDRLAATLAWLERLYQEANP